MRRFSTSIAKKLGWALILVSIVAVNVWLFFTDAEQPANINTEMVESSSYSIKGATLYQYQKNVQNWQLKAQQMWLDQNMQNAKMDNMNGIFKPHSKAATYFSSVNAWFKFKTQQLDLNQNVVVNNSQGQLSTPALSLNLTSQTAFNKQLSTLKGSGFKGTGYNLIYDYKKQQFKLRQPKFTMQR